jgi:carbonic anhydrase
MHASIPSVTDDPRYKDKLIDIVRPDDVPPLWKGTPIEQLILSQNFHLPIAATDGKPQLLIATCMEFRYALPIPRMYAYVMRRAGGRIIGSEFSVAYTLAKGVKYLALIGHNDCGMTKVWDAAPQMAKALVEYGWEQSLAEDFIERHADRYVVDDELDALKQEYYRLRGIFKGLTVAPLFVSLGDNKIHVPCWFIDSLIDGKEPLDGAAPSKEIQRTL